MDSMVGRAVVLESKDPPLTCGDPVAHNSSAEKPCRDFGHTQSSVCTERVEFKSSDGQVTEVGV